MRTTPFRAVLEEVLASCGLVYDAANQTQLDTAANCINRRLAEMWDWTSWPETVRSQKRGFADQHTTALPYAAGDVLWDDTAEAYYEAKILVPVGIALTNTTYWGVATRPTASLIEWEQYGADEIGRVWRVTKADWFTDTARNSYS